MTLSRSSALFLNVFSIFDMHDVSGPLFLNTTSFCAISFHLQQVKGLLSLFIAPLTTVYALL